MREFPREQLLTASLIECLHNIVLGGSPADQARRHRAAKEGIVGVLEDAVGNFPELASRAGMLSMLCGGKPEACCLS
jgi:hypothetical protein